jgi:hypothetical protein
MVHRFIAPKRQSFILGSYMGNLDILHDEFFFIISNRTKKLKLKKLKKEISWRPSASYRYDYTSLCYI